MYKTGQFFVLVLLSSLICPQQVSAQEPDPLLLDSIPLHKRITGQKVLVISGETNDFKYIIPRLEMRKIPYEHVRNFDFERQDYSEFFAIIVGTNMMRPFATDGKTKIQHLEHYVRDGGHIMFFGTFNAVGFVALHHLKIMTGFSHNSNFRLIEGKSEVLFHGHEKAIPKNMKSKSYGHFNAYIPHVDLLLRGEGSWSTSSAFSTIPLDKGRISITMFESEDEGVWVYPPITDWIINGAPTTVEQLDQRPLVDPITYQLLLNGPQEELSEKLEDQHYAELRAVIAGQEGNPAKLLELSESQQENPKKFLLLKMAAGQFAKNGDANAAVSTILVAANLYRIDHIKEQTNLLTLCLKSTSDRAKIKDVARLSLDYYEAAVERYQYGLAWKLIQIAEQASQLSGNRHYQKLAKENRHSLQPIHVSWQRVSDSLAAWRQKPDDPKLNTIVGKFLAFVANDWSIALPTLAMGNDDELKELANLTLEPSESAITRIRIADRWTTYAEKLEGIEKVNVQRQVQKWYREVQDDLNDLNGSDEDRARNILRENYSTQPAELSFELKVDGRGVLSVFSDRMEWETQAGREISQIQVNDQI
jgi:hypothetical protein